MPTREPRPAGLIARVGSWLAYRPPNTHQFILPELEPEERGRVQARGRNLANYEFPAREKEQKQGTEKKRKPIRVREWRKAKADQGSGAERLHHEQDEISPDIRVSLEIVNRELNTAASNDIVIREFKLARGLEAFVAFVDGMADRDMINDFILRQLMNPAHFTNYAGGDLFQYLADHVLAVNQVEVVTTYEKAANQVLTGVTVLFADGCNSCLAVDTRGYEKRGIEKPFTEAVVRGPQEGFTENLKTCTTQIRRIIKSKDLINEIIPVADRAQAAIMYIKGLTNPAVVREVKRRLKSIKTDIILADGMLEQFIEDHPWMIIPQVLTTERPDRAASHLMEGKVVIIAEGTPFAIVVPVSVHALMHSPEDSFLRWQFGTAIRLVRMLAFAMALLLPGVYVALTNYHQEMLPTDLLISISRAREGVPFPTIIEVLLMEISFELIREAGVRVPGIIGTTLGIIGALILGQAAVAANVVSPILIIIVALTGLGNFALPSYSLAFAVRALRFFFIGMGTILGFVGISAGLVAVAAMATSIKSFGVPFLAPGWPKTRRSPDLFIRLPVWKQELRPDYVQPLNLRRQPHVSRGWAVEDPEPGNEE